jgi:hypothetical protein
MMTEREALKETRKLWLYLAEHPRTTKMRALQVLKMPDYYLECPCCEYLYQKTYDTRTERELWSLSSKCNTVCPLRHLWPHKSGYGCEYAENSPYAFWVRCEGEDDMRKKYALEIANACLKKNGGLL